jgi:hypothetical protein
MITNVLPAHCDADHRCHRAPCFEAQLEAQNGALPVRKSAELCANHLGDMVQSLTAWARSRGLTRGQVTVLAIDPTWPSRATGQAIACEPSRAFRFGTIPLT